MSLNTRCPLQCECERKCKWENHELDCDYYKYNGIGDSIIEDQEDKRRMQENEVIEAKLDSIPDDTDDPFPKTNGIMTYLPVDRLHPHPDNPRKDLGDLTELAESIKANDVLQNLTVVEESVGQYTVIIGHRRLAAAKLAGLEYVPCVIADLSPKEQIATMLLENMQRSDLTVYEQAQGIQMMLDMGSTVEEISEKTGFSSTTVRRRAKMMELDQKTLKDVSDRQLSLGDFDRLSQIEDITERNRCLEKIGTADFNSSVANSIKKQTIAAKLPAIKKFLKDSGAKAIKSSDQYSMKYDSVGSYMRIPDIDTDALSIPADIKGTVYYYLDESYGSLQFYREREKAKPEKKSEAQIEQERKLAEAWKTVDELNAVAYKLRSDFVSGLTVTAKNTPAMLKGALYSIIVRAIDYECTDRKLLSKVLGFDDSTYSPSKSFEALAALDKADDKDIPQIIYANFNDSEKKTYSCSYHNLWPKHNDCSTLDALYLWLCSLGYEMSADERAMQDGSHEIFKEEKPEAGNES